ncbi:alanyl-tRNA editing protein Aarsd1-like isoform X3 [Phasianus colchicus]|uniref:alanyl-tRNA editing protein Aarsd1-like isoform X3 n=1 Tax=Phasianus colchicus TaxID=9054 RepID=UPI00129DF855|nr:alanyl-tRNA editing protein Aarsd1-like isoform X3 [Phasianus colchicus]
MRPACRELGDPRDGRAARAALRGGAPPVGSARRAGSAALRAPPQVPPQLSGRRRSPSLRSLGRRRHGVPLPAGQLGPAVRHQGTVVPGGRAAARGRRGTDARLRGGAGGHDPLPRGRRAGQHLITAMAERMFGFKTTSWELGRQQSVIELDTPSMTTEQMEALEQSVNEKIRERIPVTVRELAADDSEVETVRSRGLPGDHTGPVRVVDIEGIDSNMCCGTHVSNLSDLQVIKLLCTEKGKKNKTNLVFLAGNRVLKSVQQSHRTEKTLTSLLKNGPGEHVEAVKRLQSSVKLLQKNNLNLLRDIAVLIARDFKSKPVQSPLFVLHRKEGDSEFMNIIANEIGKEDILLFLTVGDEKEAGLFLLAGSVEAVENLGPRLERTTFLCK